MSEDDNVVHIIFSQDDSYHLLKCHRQWSQSLRNRSVHWKIGTWEAYLHRKYIWRQDLIVFSPHMQCRH